jgi:predicted nucleotidyltransferase
VAAPIPPDIRDALSRYADKLRERFGPRLRFVRLFGSFARGEATEDSDIDVAAVIDGLTAAERDEAIGAVVEVELDTLVSLSPLVTSGDHFDLWLRREIPIGRVILEEGVLL